MEEGRDWRGSHYDPHDVVASRNKSTAECFGDLLLAADLLSNRLLGEARGLSAWLAGSVVSSSLKVFVDTANLCCGVGRSDSASQGANVLCMKNNKIALSNG